MLDKLHLIKIEKLGYFEFWRGFQRVGCLLLEVNKAVFEHSGKSFKMYFLQHRIVIGYDDFN